MSKDDIMSNKILALLDDQQIALVQNYFPENPIAKIQILEELYFEALEGFFLFLIDHKIKMTQKVSGIDKFISAFNGHRSYGLQLPAAVVGQQQEPSFIQYLPIRRFSMSEFLAARPWMQKEEFDRKYIRLASPLPIEVTRTNLYSATIKTFAQDISIKGMKIVGDFAPSDTVRIKSPLMPNAVFEGTVKWNTPWGQMGSIPYAGVEILHNQQSLSYKSLAKFMRELFIPNLMKSGQLSM